MRKKGSKHRKLSEAVITAITYTANIASLVTEHKLDSK